MPSFVSAFKITGRIEMREFRNQSTALVPISRLPADCISAIFLMGCSPEPEDEDDPDAGDPSFWAPKRPFCFSASTVCQRWRDIALNTPRLWSNIDFFDAAPFYYTELMLKRSKGCPLHIWLDFSRLQPMIRTAVPILRRYIPDRSISLTMVLASAGNAEFNMAELEAPGQRPPRVTELMVALHRNGRRGWTPRDMNSKVAARSVAIPMDGVRRLHLAWICPPQFVVPAYANLAELSLSGIVFSQYTIPEFEDLLRSCPRLALLRATHLTMDDLNVGDGDSEPITMPLLQTIELIEASDRSLNHLLRTLVAPALQVLHLRKSTKPEHRSYPVANALTAFLAASDPPLRDLSLYAVGIEGHDELVPMLKRLPHITSLRLARMYDASLVLTGLATYPRLCLQLESLVLVRVSRNFFDCVSLPLPKLVRPANGRPPLKRLVVWRCKDFDGDIEWLAEYVPDFTFVDHW
ncbi:hypothetical protein BOTBODRAFT_433594 [Botryobasidium botryosum FD-172 SS1]|uniref:Uncharacterized protein n=1 Tax=Botryobasidium botryosum (strain FD-172 SS1) TaxID=930990 RepID=A0A067MX25_BOTB1|nr:hypothetical protein BOTBODRAFT_433594 [Botryobasidium botryosum FD-172 SS1]